MDSYFNLKIYLAADLRRYTQTTSGIVIPDLNLNACGASKQIKKWSEWILVLIKRII